MAKDLWQDDIRYFSGSSFLLTTISKSRSCGSKSHTAVVCATSGMGADSVRGTGFVRYFPNTTRMTLLRLPLESATGSMRIANASPEDNRNRLWRPVATWEAASPRGVSARSFSRICARGWDGSTRTIIPSSRPRADATKSNADRINPRARSLISTNFASPAARRKRAGHLPWRLSPRACGPDPAPGCARHRDGQSARRRR